MTTIKRIELVAQPLGMNFTSELVDVNLDVLSAEARKLAELVESTDRRRPETRVLVEGDRPSPWRQYFEWPSRICRRGIPTETGEHYFERCARFVRESRGRVVDPRTVAPDAMGVTPC